MKQIITILFIGLISFSIKAQDKTAKISFKSDTIDYGTIEKGADGLRVFEFTNTARKPYDIAVTACVIIAKHHLGKKIKISSDGANQEWNDGKKLCQYILGYGKDFVLDEDDS